MRVTVVRVSVGMTIPLLDQHGGTTFSNIQPRADLEAELDPDDDPNDVHTILYQKAKIFCMRQALDLGGDMFDIRNDLDGYLQNFFEVGKE